MSAAVAPTHAMVLAAGRGERLRPLTDATPKPLIEVAGKALIDHALDRLTAAGVGDAVVNLWHHADIIAEHLAAREAPRIALSREDALLDTGGGIANTLHRLGAAPFFAVNSDVLWRDGAESALGRLAAAWDDGAMDGLLLLVSSARASGHDGPGDFFLAPEGAVRRRREHEIAPFVFTGIQLLHRRLFDDAPDGPFSLNLLYDRAIEADRLFGIAHDGAWLHVGTPAGLAEAKRRLGGGGVAKG